MKRDRLEEMHAVAAWGESMSIGETAHFNHLECPAGTDTRGRLYITRKDENTLLAYCHNCQRGGVWHYNPKSSITNIHQTVYEPPRGAKSLAHTDISKGIAEYLSFWGPLGDLTSTRQTNDAYLLRYGLNIEYCRKDMWSEGTTNDNGNTNDCVIWPFYDAGDLRGVQIKYTNPNIKHDPKVRTIGRMGLHVFNPNDSNTVILVEDRASGVKVAQAGYASCTMHGCRDLHTEQVHHLATLFDRIIVWLDNDNTVVRETSRSIMNKALLVANKSKLIVTYKDPKLYSEPAIREVVETLGYA